MRSATSVFGLLALVALPAHADIIGKATVIDGNTLEIAGQRIRLHRIAAPEPDQTCRWPNKVIPCGRIAGTAAMDLIAGVDRVVRATRGREPSGGSLRAGGSRPAPPMDSTSVGTWSIPAGPSPTKASRPSTSMSGTRPGKPSAACRRESSPRRGRGASGGSEFEPRRRRRPSTFRRTMPDARSQIIVE